MSISGGLKGFLSHGPVEVECNNYDPNALITAAKSQDNEASWGYSNANGGAFTHVIKNDM